MSEQMLMDFGSNLVAVLMGTAGGFAALRERIKKDVHIELEPVRAQLSQLDARVMVLEGQHGKGAHRVA